MESSQNEFSMESEKDLEGEFLDLAAQRAALQKRQRDFEEMKEENYIILQNYEERCRAARSETQKYDGILQELNDQKQRLDLDVQMWRRKLEEIASLVETLRRDEEVLQEIVDKGDEFQDIDQVIGKFQAFVELRKELKSRKEAMDVEMRNMKCVISEEIKNQDEERIQCTTDRRISQGECQTARQEAANFSRHLSTLRQKELGDQLLNQKLRLAINSMYESVINHETQSRERTENLSEQFLKVEQFFTKWSEVVETLQNEKVVLSKASEQKNSLTSKLTGKQKQLSISSHKRRK